MTQHPPIRAQLARRATVLGASASLAPSRSWLLPNLGTMSAGTPCCGFCFSSVSILFRHRYTKIHHRPSKTCIDPGNNLGARTRVEGPGWPHMEGQHLRTKVPTEARKGQKERPHGHRGHVMTCQDAQDMAQDQGGPLGEGPTAGGGSRRVNTPTQA